MSNIDKQALREEFKMMQECYSDPSDRDRQAIYIAAEALLDELEMAIDACNGWQRKFAEADERLEAAEKRIAELEAREVALPPTFWYEHDDLPREIPVLSRRLVINALRDAGIKIAATGKGE